MQADDRETMIRRLLFQLAAALGRHVRNPRRERERCDLDAGVARLSDEPALPLPVPVLEQFLTDGEFHHDTYAARGELSVRIARSRFPNKLARVGMGHDQESQRA